MIILGQKEEKQEVFAAFLNNFWKLQILKNSSSDKKA